MASWRFRKSPLIRISLVTLGVLCGAITFLGCTALGPMPATTGVAFAPAGRPSGEIGYGVVPGYYLSSGVLGSPKGTGLKQGSLVFEPDRLLRVPGLLVGARAVGEVASGGYLEPFVGYRTMLDDDGRFAAAGIGFVTHAKGNRDGASYSATRGGAEVGFDVRATPKSKWFELHASISTALTALSASGSYCIDNVSHGTMCPSPPADINSASVSGVYPSASVGVSFEFARHLSTFLHGARLSASGSAGTMPTLVAGDQPNATLYGSLGVSLTLGFGAKR